MISIFVKIVNHLFLIVACCFLLNFNSGKVYSLEPFDIQIKKKLIRKQEKPELEKMKRKF